MKSTSALGLLSARGRVLFWLVRDDFLLYRVPIMAPDVRRTVLVVPAGVRTVPPSS